MKTNNASKNETIKTYSVRSESGCTITIHATEDDIAEAAWEVMAMRNWSSVEWNEAKPVTPSASE